LTRHDDQPRRCRREHAVLVGTAKQSHGGFTSSQPGDRVGRGDADAPPGIATLSCVRGARRRVVQAAGREARVGVLMRSDVLRVGCSLFQACRAPALTAPRAGPRCAGAERVGRDRIVRRVTQRTRPRQVSSHRRLCHRHRVASTCGCTFAGASDGRASSIGKNPADKSAASVTNVHVAGVPSATPNAPIEQNTAART
jgi:hypothetical protein